MTELERKKHIRELLSKINFKYDRRIKDSFFACLSNEQATLANVDKKCYETIIIIMRDSIDRNKVVDDSAKDKIRDVLTIWNDCMIETNSFNAGIVSSKIDKIALKVKPREKENYLSSVINNIDSTIDDIEQAMITDGGDHKPKIDMLLDVKDDLALNVICTSTAEAGECYETIIECLKNIRLSVLNKTILRRDVVNKLKEAVAKWVSLTKGARTLFHNKKSEIIDFSSDDLTFGVKFQEEKAYFEDLIRVLDEKIAAYDSPIEEAIKEENESSQKLQRLKQMYDANEINKTQYVRLAKPISENLNSAVQRRLRLEAATGGIFKNSKMIRNRLKDLYMLVENCGLSNEKKYEILRSFDASKVMQGLALNDDSMKFFITLKKAETQITESIAFSNNMYNKFIISRMSEVAPEELDESYDMNENIENIDEEFERLYGIQTNTLDENIFNKNEDILSDEEILRKIDNKE